MSKLALIVLGWVVLGMNAQGASFDCGKASTKVEHLICDNPEISKLDEELAWQYIEISKTPSINKSILQTEQKSWLKLRNQCGEAGEESTHSSDIECVRIMYESRLAGLHVGQYKMTSGKGYSVCEAYKRTVSKLGKLPGALSCPDKYLDKTAGISRPAWRPIPFDFNLYLKLMTVSAAHSTGMADYDPFHAEKPFDPSKHPQFVKIQREIAAKAHYQMAVAELDTNRDGKTEIVLRLEQTRANECNWHGLFFVNRELTDLDETPYFTTLPERTMNTYGYPVTGLTDVVLYGEKIYFFQGDYREFFFIEDSLGGRLPICSFEYVKGYKK